MQRNRTRNITYTLPESVPFNRTILPGICSSSHSICQTFEGTFAELISFVGKEAIVRVPAWIALYAKRGIVLENKAEGSHTALLCAIVFLKICNEESGRKTDPTASFTNAPIICNRKWSMGRSPREASFILPFNVVSVVPCRVRRLRSVFSKKFPAKAQPAHGGQLVGSDE